MNRQELDQTLKAMSAEQFKNFVGKFGGEHADPDSFVSQFILHPEWEQRLCQLLGFLTEQEKMTKAVLRASSAAIVSAILAAIAAVIAFLSLLFTWI